MITVGGKVINPEHVTLVVHPGHSAYVQVYFTNGKHVEISTGVLEGLQNWDKETPLQVITRLLEEDRAYFMGQLARAVRGLD